MDLGVETQAWSGDGVSECANSCKAVEWACEKGAKEASEECGNQEV